MSVSDDTVYTEHLRTFDPSSAVIPERVLGKLRSTLRRMLSKRGLLRASAGTFGYSGDKLGDREAFEDFVRDAYLHAFYGVGNRAGFQHGFLKKQVDAGNDIDRLISETLRKFVHDMHRKAFPREAGIYKNVVAAAKLLLREPNPKATRIDSGNEKLGMRSIIGLIGDREPSVDSRALSAAIPTCKPVQDVLAFVTRFSKSIEGDCEWDITDHVPGDTSHSPANPYGNSQ